MNSIYYIFAIIAVSLALTAADPPQETKTNSHAQFFLHWITYQTKWPITIENSLMKNSNCDDWFKYDTQSYVSQLPNFKPNYFISKDSQKTELTIFNYNVSSHEQLTTYEPVQILDDDELADQKTATEYHTLVYLKSHRIRIDRDTKGVYANVTCIADFLVDQSSLNVYKNLVENMKDYALFTIDSEEETQGDLQNFRQKILQKQYLQSILKKKQQIKYQRRQNLLMNPKLVPKVTKRKYRTRYYSLRDKRDVETAESKTIMNVRLSFGPIFVPQPIQDRVVSCSLDLVNADKMKIDYQNTVFKLLSSNDLGLDKNAEDLLEFNSGNTLNTNLIPKVATETHNSPKLAEELSDAALNNIFQKQQIVDSLEQKLIKQKGPKKFEAIAKQIVEKTNESTKPENQKIDEIIKDLERAQQRRTNDDFIMNDKLMFILDKPLELNLDSLNISTSRYFFNKNILICIAFLNVFFYSI